MASLPHFRWFSVRQAGPALVVRFVIARLLKEVTVETVGDDLFSLVDEWQYQQIVLDFSEVDRVYSGLLAKILTLRKKVEAVGGQLALCGLNPDLTQVFETTQLHTLVQIYATADDALRGLGAPQLPEPAPTGETSAAPPTHDA
jgi:anti-anti-sigma factor